MVIFNEIIRFSKPRRFTGDHFLGAMNETADFLSSVLWLIIATLSITSKMTCLLD